MNLFDITGVLLGLAVGYLLPLFVIQLVKWSHDRMDHAAEMTQYRFDLWLSDIQFWQDQMQSDNPFERRLAAQLIPVLYANPPADIPCSR